MLISCLVIDPITVSIILSAFLSLSKPIGGLVFGVAFWNISRIISYERNIRTYMIISGWGILLIFATNQAPVQMLAPYPPFGLATITILITAAYLMQLGIYNSILVSANNELHRSIHKHALESNLLGLIGQAEMEKEIQKTVKLYFGISYCHDVDNHKRTTCGGCSISYEYDILRMTQLNLG